MLKGGAEEGSKGIEAPAERRKAEERGREDRRDKGRQVYRIVTILRQRSVNDFILQRRDLWQTSRRRELLTFLR